MKEYRFTVYSTELRKRAVVRVMASCLTQAVREPMLLTCCTGWMIARVYRVNGQIRSSRDLPESPADLGDYMTVLAEEVRIED